MSSISERDRSREGVIALEETSELGDRSATYAKLNASGFRFAGIALGRSLWTRLDELPLPAPVLPVRLPTLATAQQAGKSFFDDADAPLYISGSLSLSVHGWAFVERHRPATPDIFVEVRDMRTGKVEYYTGERYERPDVAQHFKDAALSMCGFRVRIPMRGRFFPQGLRLRALQCDREQCFSCPVELAVERGLQEFKIGAREELARTFLRGSGIEIGALQRKLVLPSSCEVRYVDRMSMPDLLHHYPELQGMPLQAPDLIDDGEALNTVAGRSLDFVIANHFFEHSQNPIQTLRNFLRVLKPTGVLFLAVPDKRYTFDSERPSTAFSTLEETYRTGERRDRTALFAEWARFVEQTGEADVPAKARQLMEETYSIHYNVWNVDELLSFVIAARKEFQLPFEILAAVSSDNEAILLLERTL
jgi:SAM-dependent methyltransferase